MDLFYSSIKRCLIFVTIAVGGAIVKAEEYSPKFFLKQLFLYVIVLLIMSLFLTLYEVMKIKLAKNKNKQHES